MADNASPRSAAEIDLDWLQRTVGAVVGARVGAFDCETLGAGVGLVGELARVRLDWAEAAGGPASVVAKFAAPSEEARSIAAALGFYEMEHNFYRDLRPHLPVRAPECFCNDYDPATGDVTLLMSDVPGNPVDQLTGCSAAQARLVARELGRLHGCAEGQPWQTKATWLRRMDDAAMAAAEHPLLQKAVPIALEQFRASAPDWFVDLAPDYPDLCSALGEHYAPYPVTLLHGDARADNMMFDGDSGVTLLDWQVVLAGPGAYDLVYFMSQSMQVGERRAAEAGILAAYAQGLAEYGVAFDAQAFGRLRQICALTQLSYPLHMAPTMDDGPERTRTLVNAMFARACAAVEDCGALELAEAMR